MSAKVFVSPRQNDGNLYLKEEGGFAYAVLQTKFYVPIETEYGKELTNLFISRVESYVITKVKPLPVKYAVEFIPFNEAIIMSPKDRNRFVSRYFCPLWHITTSMLANATEYYEKSKSSMPQKDVIEYINNLLS